MSRTSPQLEAQLRAIAARYGTPTYVYDAATIRSQFARLKSFDTVRFAQKACPNIHIQRLLKDAGALVDCVSLGELERAHRAGYRVTGEPSEIVYTADLLTPAAIARVVELGVPVNAGSEDMLSQLGEVSRGHKVWLRVNPGFGHGHSKKTNTGGEASKHGIWHEHLATALAHIDRYELDLVGLHMHIGSGTELQHLARVCDAMVQQVKSVGRDIRAISGGGGLSIPYREGQSNVDTDAYFRLWDAARKRIEEQLEHPVHLELEPGRFLVGASGFLVSEVRASKDVGRNRFTLVDAGFNDLMRPVMYGSYHDIEVLGAKTTEVRPTIIGGPMCESGDVFTQEAGGDLAPRDLPAAAVGDLLVFHDAGAYGSSMGSNYNTRPLPAEVLLDGDSFRLIRRRQTVDDLLRLEEELDG